MRSGPLEVTVAPEIGGSIASFSCQSESKVIDIFRPLHSIDSGPELVLEMGCFPLVPYSNRIRGGRLNTANGIVQFPRIDESDPHSCHGTGWRSTWQLIDSAVDSVTLKLAHDDSLPVQFEATQNIQLTPDALVVDLSIRNIGRNSFPVGLGLHPYFAEKERAFVRASIETEWYLDEDSMPLHQGDSSDRDNLEKGKAAVSLKAMSAYAGWNGMAVISWPDQRVDVAISTKPALPHLLMWAPPAETFFCVEPVSHGIDGFNLADLGHKDVGGDLLESSEIITQRFSFTVRCGS